MSTAPSAPGAMRPPRVFISYADESVEHVELVGRLWRFLRSQGINAKLDRVAAQQRQDWALWMGDQVRLADHVLVIASVAYRRRAEGRSGSDEGRGVQYEARLIRDAFYRDPHNLNRFLPVVLPGQSNAGVPDFLAPASATLYYVSGFTVAGAESLLRLVLGLPKEAEPPLGPFPLAAHAVDPPIRIVESAPRPLSIESGANAVSHNGSDSSPEDGPAWLIDRLDRLDVLVDELDGTETAVRGQYPKVLARVLGTPPPTSKTLDLRLRAEPLRAAGRARPDEPRLLKAVSAAERAAVRALGRARDRQRDYVARLDRWARLVGTLDAYRAEAQDGGLVEDLALGELYRSTDSMFRTGPCDLDTAEEAVQRYAAAVRRRRGRLGEAG